MHLRLASAGTGDRLTRRAAAFVIACGLIAAGCSPRQASPSVTLAWTVAPDPPRVGPARFLLTLTHAPDGRPVTGAQVRLEGNMSHPGMTPVVAQAREVAPGRYEAELELSMRGDWVVLVEAHLAGASAQEAGVFTEEIPLRASAGEPTPNAGHATPKVGHATPNAGHAAPNAAHARPNAGHVTPNVAHVTPNAGHVTPNAGHVMPNAGHATPNAGHATLNAGHATPNAGHTTPSLPSPGGNAAASARILG